MDSDRDAAALRRQLADPLLAATHPVYRPLLWTLLGCVLLFIGWAAWAQLDEVTRGDGRVVPFSRIQKIQSLEGGILDRLLVKEGDLVEVGQPLVRLDETRFLTNFQESANQASVLRAAIARLDAEVLGKKSIEFPPDVDPEGPLARSEREAVQVAPRQTGGGHPGDPAADPPGAEPARPGSPAGGQACGEPDGGAQAEPGHRHPQRQADRFRKAPISRMPIPSAHSARPISAPWNRSSSSARTSCAAPRSCRQCAGG